MIRFRFHRAAGVLLALVALTFNGANLRAADSDGIALAIVYDTSGSMKDPVRTGQGKREAKYLVANRALRAIVNRVESYVRAAPAGTRRRVDAGLYVFNIKDAMEAISFGPFRAEAYRAWLDRSQVPTDGTPLGKAIRLASGPLLKSPLARKHLVVVTDGLNNSGPEPAVVLPSILESAKNGGGGLSVHFVAFDVDAKVFASVKRLGATVVGAADETQLNTQLEFIFEKKILLEDEEPPVAPKR